MKYIFPFFIILFCIESLSAQLLYPEVMEIRSYLSGPVSLSNRNSAYPIYLYKKNLNNRILENPSVRYALQNLKNEHYSDPQIGDAINTLTKYAEDEKLKYIIDYLKKYTQQNIPKKEQALEILQQQITYDSIEFYKNNEHLLTGDYEDYLNTDLQTFVHYIRQDSNYVWLKNAGRDSILLEILSMADNSVRLWVNNGRSKYYRFWAANKQGDTIGTWIQVMPSGHRLKIYIDEDVYQTPAIERKKMVNGNSVPNIPGKEYFVIQKPKLGEIRRRYWTYYSEVEIAMSQGKLANWASGGENSLSLLSNIRYFWNYNRNKTSWENWVHYRFGFMKNGSEDIRKNEDRFELNSKLGQKAFKHWYYTAQFNTLTQLFSSYEYPKDKEKKLVANFMSPGYFTLSLGLDYKPNDHFSLFISPIAGKWNFVRDTTKISATRYGVEKGKRAKRDAGARIDMRSKITNLFDLMDVRNEVTLFWSYDNNNKKKDDEEHTLPLTANWKLTIDFKINYFMRASIYTETIYDENYSNKIQFKENLNLGVNFRF
ncbi:MAG: DUF3078 domain-containing protein [Odoribacter sp.]